MPPGDGLWSCQECTEWLLLPLILSRVKLHTTPSTAPQPFHLCGGAYTSGALQSHPIPLPSVHGREGSFLPGCLPPGDVVNSESGDSGVVIGCHVDELTCTWSVECFIASSHIYPGFMGKVSIPNHFPFEPGCEEYSFFDQAKIFSMVLILSLQIPLTHQN